MKPKNREKSSQQEEMFRNRLENLIDPKHALSRLANEIEWEVFEREFGAMYVENVGRQGLPIRLMVGLHYLKYTYNVSDEQVVERFLENPYWQYFCGYEYFQHQFPCDPSSMTKWRNRIGVEGIEKLLKETIEVAKRAKLIKSTDLEKVNVDTTVQEKAIAFPTDARLYHKMRLALVREANKIGLQLRQTYTRLSKRALRKQGSYAQAKQSKRANREIKKLKTYLGRVMRDILRKCSEPTNKLIDLLFIAERIISQQKHDSNKIYSVQSTEVECIAKGKAHKKYEFGVKVSLVTTSKRNWVVGCDAKPDNPYDGHTLKPAIAQVEKLTGQKPLQAFADRSYRGTKHHPDGVAVYISGRRNLPPKLKDWLMRRSAIEPIISHLKFDHRMDRNYLLGTNGDRINAILAGAGFNLRKLLNAFFLFFFNLLFNFSFNRKSVAQKNLFLATLS